MRTDATNPGRVLQVWRGMSCVFEGTLTEPVPAAEGWQISAVGAGAWGGMFQAVYSTWSNPDDPINQAIARGLRWRNPPPGITGSAGSQVWLGSKVDSGSQTITDQLNMYCTQGALVWQVGRFNTLSVGPIPSRPNRVLVATDPVPRTIANDINALWIKYQATADTDNGSATYGLTEVTAPASVAAHGITEEYADLTPAGVMTGAQARANGSNVLSRYQRANFSGSFAVRFGQLLTTGGTPVDLGAEQAGTVCRLVLLDYGLGGEVIPGPISFVTGSYSYDDAAQVATVTPMQSISADLSSLLSAMFPQSSSTS